MPTSFWRRAGCYLKSMTASSPASAVPSGISALVFVNREAGRGRGGAYLPRIRQLFESLQVPARFEETNSAGELESAAREAAAQNQNQRLLLAMGGDGTFQALANGVLGTDAVIGILPVGGGNDFACALGLSRNPLEAAEQVLSRKPRYVDLVRARTADGRTRMYAGGGGIGLDAEAARHASGAFRRLPGRSRYIAAALRAVFERQPLRVRLEFPESNHQPTEAAALVTCVLNTPTYGAGLRLAPEAVIDDGLVQAVLVEDMTTMEVLKLLPRLTASGKLGTPRVKRWTVKSVRVSADRPCLFHGDGEIFGPAPVEIEVVPRAVRVLAPGCLRPDHTV
jgi:diacylglycerol kinase (ATP)